MQLKYKYLSGVATDKDSPTLRKAYQEDYSKCPSPFKEQASFDRNIAVRHSEIRLSRNYGDSDNRRSRQHSPSCNTFNPKQPTQQFSPYEQQQEYAKDKIILRQLTEQNQLLKQQMSQLSEIYNKMKSDTSSKIAELTHRNIELANRNSELERAQAGHRIDMDLLANNHRAEVMYYESVIVQLNIDMQSILEKQDIMELQKMKEQRSNREFIRQMTTLKDGVDSSLGGKPKKQAGKVLNKSATTSLREQKGNSKQNTRMTREMRIQEENEECSQLQETAGVDRNRHQQLIDSIKKMYFKIVGTEARSLKELWKWLKQVVSQHSSLKKWGQRIAQLTEQDLVGSAKEIIDQACRYLQEERVKSTI